MSEQQPEPPEEGLTPEEKKEQLDTPSVVSTSQSPDSSNSTAASKSIPHPETEWVPGEQLELIRIPQPTIWPATVALGVTGMAFGVVTQWILSAAGLFLFVLGIAGWIEDLKKDV